MENHANRHSIEDSLFKIRGSILQENKGVIAPRNLHTAMDKESYHRVISRIREDKILFPFEEPSNGD
jgi:hypothetical protein